MLNCRISVRRKEQIKSEQEKVDGMELKDEKSEQASIMRQLTSEDNQKLYNVLLKIKQSLSTSVVQLFSAVMSEQTFQWESTVTGVVCLTKTDENVYAIEVCTSYLL
jgi:hypothetical protein